ncbi:MAG: family phosphatase [Rubritepida sp.]|nr:family phosphatase [Rubritepida sp.]
MLKALLVDFDGTLVESEHANAAAYAAALGEHGVAVEADAILPGITGRAWGDFLPELLADAPGTDPAAVGRGKRAIYPDFFGLIRPNEALADLLRATRLGSLATGLVTTAAAGSTEAILERFALCGLFDILVCGDHVSRAKPDPEGYHLAARQLGVRPEECMVIEDSETGLAAARAFGGHVLRWTGGA